MGTLAAQREYMTVFFKTMDNKIKFILKHKELPSQFKETMTNTSVIHTLHFRMSAFCNDARMTHVLSKCCSHTLQQ